ncbi:hypothetical protein MMC31_006101 [Peltigera leucophlebia]|nr:hypothetical protein [Peltigera leucophlebia]
MLLRQIPSRATAPPYHHPYSQESSSQHLHSPPTTRNAMRINKHEPLISMSDPPHHTKHPPLSSSPRGLPLDPITILGIFLMIAIAAYALHVFLWTYFPPDGIIPNETDVDIVIGAADRRRPRVRQGRRLQWVVGSSSGNSDDPTREEEDGEEGERYELDELRKSSEEGEEEEEEEEERALRPQGFDAYAEDGDGDEHAESTSFIMLPRHLV